MLKIKTSLAVCSLLFAITTPMAAMTADEVIAKHIEAKGGLENWSKVETIKLTGSFTGFSKVAPFTMIRARDNRYFMDYALNEHKVVIGHDGETAWWDNSMRMEGSTFISGADLEARSRDFDFATPFFDMEAKGYEATLIGDTDFEGDPAIGIELARGDGSTETWYLDPETFLEIGRVSPGSDFGRPMPQRTVFDEHREVEGVMIPHYTESQWYTRDRIMEADSVEVNVEIDDAIFAMPAPLGMGPLQSLAGEWDVHVETWQRPGAEAEENDWTASVEAMLRGGLLQETFTTARGTDIVRTLTYDRFKKVYKLTEIDGTMTQLDLQEGDFGEDGKLIMSNLETGTAGEQFGTTTYTRTSITDIGESGFRIEQEVSRDGGENWFLQRASTYRRGAAAEAQN